jgi:hypothetical protein
VVLDFTGKHSEEVELSEFIVSPVLGMALIWVDIFIAQVAHAITKEAQICCS